MGMATMPSVRPTTTTTVPMLRPEAAHRGEPVAGMVLDRADRRSGIQASKWVILWGLANVRLGREAVRRFDRDINWWSGRITFEPTAAPARHCRSKTNLQILGAFSC